MRDGGWLSMYSTCMVGGVIEARNACMGGGGRRPVDERARNCLESGGKRPGRIWQRSEIR